MSQIHILSKFISPCFYCQISEHYGCVKNAFLAVNFWKLIIIKNYKDFLSAKTLLVPFAKSFLINAKKFASIIIVGEIIVHCATGKFSCVYYIFRSKNVFACFPMVPTLENLLSQALISGPAHQPGYRDGGGGGSGQRGGRPGQDDSHPCGRAQVAQDLPSKIPGKM